MVGWQFPADEAAEDGASRMASEPATPTASTLAIAIPVNERARMRCPACATDLADLVVSANNRSERMDAPFGWCLVSAAMIYPRCPKITRFRT
jgi:hypothetical protein